MRYSNLKYKVILGDEAKKICNRDAIEESLVHCLYVIDKYGQKEIVVNESNEKNFQ